MESGSCSIEVKVMSCKDLRAFNFFQKLSVFAIVSIVSDDPDKKLEDPQQQQQKTPADKDGDGNPEWNHVIQFHVKEADRHHLFIHFDLRSEGLVFGIGDKFVGEARVPLDDLIQPESNRIVRFVSYQVRSGDGKPNGVLNFSYKAVMDEVEKKGEMASPSFSSSSPSFSSASPAANGIAGFPIFYHPTPPQPSIYPTIELDKDSPPTVQQIHYPSPSMHHPPHQAYYPPPHLYHLAATPPPPLLPPPPLFLPLPPPPPPLHHHHLPPYSVYSWGPNNPNWGTGFDGGQRWAHGYGAGEDDR